MARFAGLLLLISGAARAFQPALLRSSVLAARQLRNQLHRTSVMMSESPSVELQQNKKWSSVFGNLKAAGRRVADVLFGITESEADTVLQAFEEGRGLKSLEKKPAVNRKDLLGKLGRILQPQECNRYRIIIGERGTGKTTAVKQALAALKSPRGAVYFDCPEIASTFSVSLANLIGFHRQLDTQGAIQRRIKGDVEPLATFKKLQQPIKDAAAKFRAKNGRPMVLVIDSVDFLAKQFAPFLGILQDFAKECADDGDLRFVFISTDGAALPFMMARSSWSRAGKPIEIGEIPDDQAVEYLAKKGVPEDQAKLAVANVADGLFDSLQDFVEAISEGETYEQFVLTRDRALRKKLSRILKFPVTYPLFEHLVKHKIVGTDEALVLVGMDQSRLDILLEYNILAAHPDEIYTFHNRHTAVWFSRELATLAA